jgi:hypothetical protein
MRRALAICLVTMGCAEEPTGAPDPTCDEQGDELVLLARSMSFGREVDGVSPGFDLDGAVTAEGDPAGCGIADLVGPNGAPGIDNALASVIPVLERTEAGVLEPLIQDSINNGALLLMARLAELDDPRDDACVDVSVFKGAGAPMLGNDGWILANQTIQVDPASLLGNEATDVQLDDGALVAGPMPRVALPIQVLDLNDTLEVFNARLGLTAREDGTWHGYLSGGLEVEMLIETASLQNVDPVVVELVGPVLRRLADLAPDEAGVCQQLSAVFEVEMVPAFVWEE